MSFRKAVEFLKDKHFPAGILAWCLLKADCLCTHEPSWHALGSRDTLKNLFQPQPTLLSSWSRLLFTVGKLPWCFPALSSHKILRNYQWTTPNLQREEPESAMWLEGGELGKGGGLVCKMGLQNMHNWMLQTKENSFLKKSWLIQQIVQSTCHPAELFQTLRHRSEQMMSSAFVKLYS